MAPKKARGPFKKKRQTYKEGKRLGVGRKSAAKTAIRGKKRG